MVAAGCSRIPSVGDASSKHAASRLQCCQTPGPWPGCATGTWHTASTTALRLFQAWVWSPSSAQEQGWACAAHPCSTGNAAALHGGRFPWSLLSCCREFRYKTNITFHDNDTVSYLEYRNLFFRPDLSNGTEDEYIVMPNILMLVRICSPEKYWLPSSPGGW